MTHDDLPGIRAVHPGEVLREDTLPDLGLPMATIAERLGVSRQTLYEVINERRAISADLALRLSRVIGGSAQMWLGMQAAHDIKVREHAMADELMQLTPVREEAH